MSGTHGYGRVREGPAICTKPTLRPPRKRRHVVHQKMSRKLLPPPRASCPGSSRNAHEPRQLEHRVLAYESEGEGRNRLLSELGSAASLKEKSDSS